MKIDGYYICDNETQTPIVGPYQSVRVAATIIACSKSPEQFCTASRYQLSKDARFPRNKQGDKAIFTLLTLALNRILDHRLDWSVIAEELESVRLWESVK